ncbi:STAS domain-containing protein [Diaphorobacter sp.]|uniref:STAS domain-containing protein n=1 Tax=Diaphorobacter sp. TaxID=1934310 RepID=UPI003D147E4B
MSKEPTSPGGLLSKMVRFVRNPTVNWSDLDAQEEMRESQYSKQMLKEMIERKRRNDFVRRREFDQLRKLRQSEALQGRRGEDAAARTSFFQSSLTSPDDRASTLRKIDEIEAQMSQQWWKAKGQPDSGPAMVTAPVDPSTSPALAAPAQEVGPLAAPADAAAAQILAAGQPAPASAAIAAALASSGLAGEHARAFAPTAPLSVPPAVDEVAAVKPLFDQAWPADPQSQAQSQAQAPQPQTPGAVQVPQVTTELEEFVHEPDLEEAAIRFAHGDYSGAQSVLKEVLVQHQHDDPQQQHDIWMTLFDLYRAIGQQDEFDVLAIEYAARFGRSAPLWFSLPEQLGLQSEKPATAVPQRELNWNAQPVLSLQSVAALQALLARSAPPWTLTWTRLTDIEPPAVTALAEQFEAWAERDVQLRFTGVHALQAVLQARTPSGDRSVDPQWWRLRMAVLRVMGLPDEFELVALDYCVTYEVSPPSWAPPLCGYSGDDGPRPAALQEMYDSELFLSGFALSQPGVASEGPVPCLQGHIEGDATPVLEPLEAMMHPGIPLRVDCGRLVRMDFAAAGSVLNWAAAQQAQGHVVQFCDLHRLVAVFFNVVGVNEHAWVVPRKN